MDQRKSLVILLFIISFSSKVFAISAWLPKPGKYKFSFSMSAIDNYSSYNKQRRISRYRKIKNKINYLNEREEELKKTMNDLIQGLLVKLKTMDDPDIIKIKEIRKKYDSYIAANRDKIESLKRTLYQLKSYQDNILNNYSLEYGANENISFGIKTLFKENYFIDSEFTKFKSNSYSNEIFLKYKIFQNQHYILSLQSQISAIKDSGYKEEIFKTITLLTGYSKKKKTSEFFAQGELGISVCQNSACNNKSNYNFAFLEGIKSKKGFMLINFTKYTFRKNYDSIYASTIYEQISIAKQFKLNEASSADNFTIQMGYFWERSIKYNMYKISGTVFSFCFEL